MEKSILKMTSATRERERERESGAGAAGANEEFDPRYITAERKRLKPFAALLFTTSSPRGRRYKCGQLIAQQLLMRGQKSAFTLAEVLITLAVIGIVAALTIGIFLPKIHSTIRARQIATAEVKFTKAMEQMALNNAIGPYYETTQEFADELQNYLKIAKVCDNEHLEDCFGYDKLLLSNGEEFELSEIKSGENLGKTADGTEYLETVGLVTIDGTGMILSWNKKCDILEPKVYKWGNNTNETTSCVAMLMDINLDKSPNRINKDIALFRADTPHKSQPVCGIQFGDYCWGTPFTPTPLTYADCTTNKESYGIIDCYMGNNDYWGGAMKQCKSQGKRLPTGQELAALATYLYGTNVPYNGETYTGASYLTMNITTLSNLSETLSATYTSNGNYFNLWSSAENTQYGAWTRYFYSTTTTYDGSDRFQSDRMGICVP